MENPYQAPNASIGDGGLVPCIGCGKDIHATAAMCPHCGASQRTKRYKSKTAAALLAFFLGGLGVHRFYLGQWWGIFYLLFFWAWIPGLIAIIEFVVFLVADQKKWDIKYNEGKSRAPGEGSGGIVVAIIIGVIFFIAIIGILAAVSIPAYHDYTVRAKTSAIFMEVAPVKQKVEGFVDKHEMMPDSNIMLGLEEPYYETASGHQITVSSQGIEVLIQSESVQIDGETILFVPLQQYETIEWDCSGGTLAMKYRPAKCRSN